MIRPTVLVAFALALSVAAVGCGQARSNAPPRPAAGQNLVLFVAGTLAKPFDELDRAFEAAHPGVHIERQAGGSVMMAKRVTDLGQQADVVAVADAQVIPDYLFSKQLANWYLDFASNAVAVVYTDRSKGAAEINDQNWYEVLSWPGVVVARSNPNTDPSGYQALWAMQLAEGYYHRPGLMDGILKNSAAKYMSDTETNLLGALQAGEIDYLFIYRSIAVQHGLKSVSLPAAINLSDPAQAGTYQTARVKLDSGKETTGTPIVYAVTIPSNTPHPELAAAFVSMLVDRPGQAIMERNGQPALSPALAVGFDQLPASLRPLAKPLAEK